MKSSYGIMKSWEERYLDLCTDVMTNGRHQNTRVGPAYALYGQSLEINPGSGEFPLLTTRKMHYKPIFGELHAFMDGCDMNHQFVSRGCNYWTPNAKAWSLNKDADDENLWLGRIYGVQWRDFIGFDQLAEVRRLLREEPTSRRIVMSTWNPCEAKHMCLPPCHLLVQFHVDNHWLNASVYMRSVDLALGLPADIALYYALMVRLAAEAELTPKSLFFHFGNAHVYYKHFAQLTLQTKRIPFEGPTFEHAKPFGPFTKDSITILDYSPLEAIKYELLV